MAVQIPLLHPLVPLSEFPHSPLCHHPVLLLNGRVIPQLGMKRRWVWLKGPHSLNQLWGWNSTVQSSITNMLYISGVVTMEEWCPIIEILIHSLSSHDNLQGFSHLTLSTGELVQSYLSHMYSCYANSHISPRTVSGVCYYRCKNQYIGQWIQVTLECSGYIISNDLWLQ